MAYLFDFARYLIPIIRVSTDLLFRWRINETRNATDAQPRKLHACGRQFFGLMSGLEPGHIQDFSKGVGMQGRSSKFCLSYNVHTLFCFREGEQKRCGQKYVCEYLRSV